MNPRLLPPTAANCKRLSANWSTRRRWWAREKKRLGTDWPSLWAFHQDVVALAIRTRTDGLSPTFAAASARTDAQRQERQSRARQARLPSSTVRAIDFLLVQRDEQRLAKFLEGRPSDELDRIERYIARKIS
jgi:hypothetical protein